jgi:low temperature requirement protein LtrA
MAGDTKRTFKTWFWQPPRPHGAVDPDRVVTNLELFYDLVFVAVISQVAGRLAGDVSPRGIFDFAVVFAMIWLAWINGTLYLEIHGRQDGRTRVAVFLQMAILVLLAVFAEGAAGESGGPFAVTYAILLAALTWLWWSVRGQDSPEYGRITAVYVAAMLGSAAVILATVAVAPTARILVWGGLCLAWVVAYPSLGRRRTFRDAVAPTESMVERFGLFTIIVLGEVVIGVVDGLSHATTDALTIVTGLLALGIGFGFWWAYFDVVGRRLPRRGARIAVWMMSHLPITMAIAAAGAGMVGLIEHAHDPQVPPATAWLITGAVAVGLLALIVTSQMLEDARRLPGVYRPIAAALVAGALASLLVGSLQPAPWVLAGLLGAILSVLWLFVVFRFLVAGAWSEAGQSPLEISEQAADPGREAQQVS